MLPESIEFFESVCTTNTCQPVDFPTQENLVWIQAIKECRVMCRCQYLATLRRMPKDTNKVFTQVGMDTVLRLLNCDQVSTFLAQMGNDHQGKKAYCAIRHAGRIYCAPDLLLRNL